MNAVIYARYSSDSQREESIASHGLRRQGLRKPLTLFLFLGYNRRTEDGRLSACLSMTTTRTTDASVAHGYNGKKRPQDHLHSRQKRRKWIKINTNQSF